MKNRNVIFFMNFIYRLILECDILYCTDTCTYRLKGIDFQWRKRQIQLLHFKEKY